MSEEKKTSWGKAYEASAPREQQRATTAASAADDLSDTTTGRPANQDPDGRSPPPLQGILGKQLRAAYGELLNAPVPDKFNDLINKLKDAEEGRKPAKAGGGGDGK